MAIDIVKTEILPSEKREHVVLMDDYGTTHSVYIPTSAVATRASIIQAETTMLQKNQDALEKYATTHWLDISQHKADGLKKKQALIAANKPVAGK